MNSPLDIGIFWSKCKSILLASMLLITYVHVDGCGVPASNQPFNSVNQVWRSGGVTDKPENQLIKYRIVKRFDKGKQTTIIVKVLSFRSLRDTPLSVGLELIDRDIIKHGKLPASAKVEFYGETSDNRSYIASYVNGVIGMYK